MRQHDHRDLCHPELAGCEQPSVSRYDYLIRADQDRIRPAKLSNRGGDLCYLFVAVRAWIDGPRNQARYGPALHLDVDTHIHRAQPAFRRLPPNSMAAPLGSTPRSMAISAMDCCVSA